SKQIYFSSENEGDAPIYRTTVDSHTWPFEFVGGFDDDLTMSADGKTIFFSRMSLGSPTESYRAKTDFSPCEVEIAGKGLQPRYQASECELSKAEPVTHLNDQVLSQ